MTDEELKDRLAALLVHSEKIDRQMEETDRRLKKTEKMLGDLGVNFGHHAEQFFQDVFDRKPVFGGVKYDEVIPNFGRKDHVARMEIDIVMINGNSVALIEAKNRIHPSFVTEFAQERVKKFRALYPEFNNYKLYLGIAGFSFDKEVLDRARENGIGIVKQVGEGVEIEAEHLKAY